MNQYINDSTVEDIEKAKEYKRNNLIKYWKPWSKHVEFMHSSHRVRAIIAGNRTGKTMTILYEIALHVTGDYPPWWKGKRFNKPVVVWVISMMETSLRDVVQRKLLGMEVGEGFLPKGSFKVKYRQGSNGTADFIEVTGKHGVSKIKLWSGNQKARDFQGDEVDIAAFDECPRPDIHEEVMVRLATTRGLAIYSFTPTEGMTPVYSKLMEKGKNGDAFVIHINMREVPWLDEDMIEAILADCVTEEQRTARLSGIVVITTGLIFQARKETYVCEPFPIPRHWPKIGGVDIGRGHPSGIVSIAIDTDPKRGMKQDNMSGIMYVYREFKQAGLVVNQLADKMKEFDVPLFGLSHDAFNDDLRGCVASILASEPHKLRCLHAGRDNWVRIDKIRDAFKMGILKIFNTCPDLINELQEYRTKPDKNNGKEEIYKVNDDVIDALQHAVHMRQFAEVFYPGGRQMHELVEIITPDFDTRFGV